MAKKQAVDLDTETCYMLLPLASGPKYQHGRVGMQVSLPCYQVRVQQVRPLV